MCHEIVALLHLGIQDIPFRSRIAIVHLLLGAKLRVVIKWKSITIPSIVKLTHELNEKLVTLSLAQCTGEKQAANRVQMSPYCKVYLKNVKRTKVSACNLAQIALQARSPALALCLGEG